MFDFGDFGGGGGDFGGGFGGGDSGGGGGFNDLINALGKLFGSGADAAGSAAQGIGNGLGTAAQGVGQAFNYPMSMMGDVGGWLGNNWQPITAYGNLGAGIGGNIMNYLSQQQMSQMPPNIMQQATPSRPAPSMVKQRLADAQASGLAGASPDFLARQAGLDSAQDLNLYRGGGTY